MRPRNEVPSLDDDGGLAVLHRRERQVIHLAAEVVADEPGDRRRIPAQQEREQVEVVDRVGLGDAHVRPWSLEPREPPGRIPHGADPVAREGCAEALRHGMEPEDVADLNQALRGPRPLDERPPLAHGAGHGLFDEAVPSRFQTLGGQRQVAVGRGDEVDGVHLSEGRAVVGDGARGRHPLLHRPAQPLARDVGHPDVGPQIAEDAEVLFAPAPEADQQDAHGPPRPASGRHRGLRRCRSGAPGPSSTGSRGDP